MSFDSNIYEIINIVDDILGKPRRDASVEGWTEYNCPCCAEENGGLVDNKYNFALTIRKEFVIVGNVIPVDDCRNTLNNMEV